VGGSQVRTRRDGPSGNLAPWPGPRAHLYGTTEVSTAKEALETFRAQDRSHAAALGGSGSSGALSAFGATSEQIQTPARTHRVAEADLSVGKATPFCSMIQL